MKEMKAPIEYNLTEDEKQKLYNDIQNAIKGFDASSPKLTKKEQMWIRKSTNCGDDKLYNAGSLFAYTAIKSHYYKVAIKYNDYARTSTEDLMSELYIAVHVNIHKYDGKHSLFTFFDPIVTSAFMIAKGAGRGGMMSKYYHDVGVTIRRAEQELKAAGFNDPSLLDIRDYIFVKFKKTISEATIERYYKYSQDIESIDASEKQYAAEDETDPELAVIEQERKIEFYEGVNKLTPRYRLYIITELEYISMYGKQPAVKVVYEKMKTQCDNLTMYEARQIQRAAHIELRSFFDKKRKKNELPLNTMKTLEADLDIIEEDEQIIVDAINESGLDSILPKEPSINETNNSESDTFEINMDNIIDL